MIYVIGDPGKTALYLVKMLNKAPSSKKGIKLPWNYYFSEGIKFGEGYIFFKKTKVRIRDINGSYIEGDACILILPFEVVKKFGVIYNDIYRRKYSKNEIEDAIKILTDKCESSL